MATCTPADLMDTYKCLACLNERELKAVAVVALAAYLGETVAETLEASKCYKCLAPKQKLQSIAAVLGDAFLSDETVAEIRERIKCLLCTDDPTLDAALIYQICQFLNARN